MHGRSFIIAVVWSWLLAFAPSIARTDGGAVRYSERHLDRIVTIFTSPTPLRTGRVDISILLQDAETGTAVTHVPIDVHAELLDAQGVRQRTLDARATSNAATNKLLCAAELNLPTPGHCRIEVSVKGLGSGPIGLDVDVEEGLPPWVETLIWMGWPLVAIALFAIHQSLVCRKRCLSIPRVRIFDSSVDRGMPSFTAAPDAPETRPRHSDKADSINWRS